MARTDKRLSMQDLRVAAKFGTRFDFDWSSDHNAILVSIFGESFRCNTELTIGQAEVLAKNLRKVIRECRRKA